MSRKELDDTHKARRIAHAPEKGWTAITNDPDWPARGEPAFKRFAAHFTKHKNRDDRK